MDGDKFNCGHCAFGHHCDELARWPKSRGPAPFALFEIPEVTGPVHVCLLPMVTEESMGLLQSYFHYRAGYLPCAGGVLDQPHAFLQAMEILGGWINQLRTEKSEKQAKRR